MYKKLELYIKIILFFNLIFVYSLYCSASNNFEEINRIKNNYKEIYINGLAQTKDLTKKLIENPPGYDTSDRVFIELQQRVPYNKKTIDSLLVKLNKDGSWKDVDYNDSARTGWKPVLHAERVLGFVRAFLTIDGEYYKSYELQNAIHSTLNFWFKNKPQSRNWYYNEIGIPRTLGTAFILFEEYLNQDEKKQAIELLKDAQFGMTGQNKVWLAGNVMMRGLLENDYNLVKQARDSIVSEIITGNKEGIKDDWCFHQHGSQQQFGNYGLAFLCTMSSFSCLLDGTSLAFSHDQLNTLLSLIINGYQWILWKGKMDINALGRQLFIDAPDLKAIAVAFAASELGNGLFSDETKDIIDNCFKNSNNLNGYNYFWQSDYAILRMKEWMASLKMSSNRVLGTESLNGDNKKGYYLGDGVLFVYENSNEYSNIFPLWDWRKIPGITCYNDTSSVPLLKNSYLPGNSGKFVGGITLGESGMNVMEFERDGLKAHKLWLFTPKAILAMGSDIKSDSSLNVTTSIEQCWLSDTFFVYNKNNKWDNNILLQNKRKELRLINGSKGYIIPNSQYIINIKNKSAYWNDIMSVYGHQRASGKVLNIYIDHGKSPQNDSYIYYIIPRANKKQIENFKIKDINVICNNNDLQIIEDVINDCWWIAAWSNANIKLKAGLNIKIHTPGLYCIKNGKDNYELFCSDPTQEKDIMNIEINGKMRTVLLPKGRLKGKTISL